jgi:Fur family transcriptional regulator, ferric uptake regulator
MAAAQSAVAASDPDVEDVLALLREHGGRVTPAKRLLVETLLASYEHRSAEQLAERVQERAPDVHLTTVYRNLEELERLGAVERMNSGHGPATYHLVSAPHGHLVCRECGSITEVPAAVFDRLAETVRREFGFAISTGQLALTGRCSDCT